jgi:hypothetical protein
VIEYCDFFLAKTGSTDSPSAVIRLSNGMSNVVYEQTVVSNTPPLTAYHTSIAPYGFRVICASSERSVSGSAGKACAYSRIVRSMHTTIDSPSKHSQRVQSNRKPSGRLVLTFLFGLSASAVRTSTVRF